MVSFASAHRTRGYSLQDSARVQLMDQRGLGVHQRPTQGQAELSGGNPLCGRGVELYATNQLTEGYLRV